MEALVLKHMGNCKLTLAHTCCATYSGTVQTEFCAHLWKDGSHARFSGATLEEVEAQLGADANTAAAQQVRDRRISELQAELARLQEVTK